jgi:hypothetical protein
MHARTQFDRGQGGLLRQRGRGGEGKECEEAEHK